MDKYDTLKYSQVKATAVSMRLRIYLCALTNSNIATTKMWWRLGILGFAPF
jgi:hypothetical protein